MIIKRYVRGFVLAVLMLGVVSFSVEALTISSNIPLSPDVNDSVGASRTFSITVNESANFTWYINGSVVQSLNENKETSSYTKSAAQGYWNVTVNAAAVNGTLSYTWFWTVTSAVPSVPQITSALPSGNPSSFFGVNQITPFFTMVFKHTRFNN